MPTSQGTLFCTRLDVEGLLSALGLAARLDDDGSNVNETDEEAYMAQGLEYATQRVKFYCSQHYTTEAQASSWLVNEWATVIAACWLCTRRGNPVPDSLKVMLVGEDGKGGVMGDMLDVRNKKARLPDVGYRHVDWPSWSNMRVDPRYRLAQIRVQRTISEGTPVETPRKNIDQGAEYNYEV